MFDYLILVREVPAICIKVRCHIPLVCRNLSICPHEKSVGFRHRQYESNVVQIIQIGFERVDFCYTHQLSFLVCQNDQRFLKHQYISLFDQFPKFILHKVNYQNCDAINLCTNFNHSTSSQLLIQFPGVFCT